MTADERQRLIAAAAHVKKPADQTSVRTIAYTGARVSEVLALRAKAVDLEAGAVRIRTLKRCVEHWRGVPVARGVAPTARDRLWNLTQATAHRKVVAVMREAGIEGPQACPKGLRHGFGTAAVIAGLLLPTIGPCSATPTSRGRRSARPRRVSRRGSSWRGCGVDMWEALSWLLGMVAAAVAVISGSAKAAEGLMKCWKQCNGQQLAIESIGENSVLDVTERHTTYGFSVRNVGRNLAKGARVQLVQVEGRGQDSNDRTLLERTFALEPVGDGGDGSTSIAMVPGRTIRVRLASSRRDAGYGPHFGVAFPAVSGRSEHYDNFAANLDDDRFTVAVVADGSGVVSKSLCIRYQ